MSLDDVTSRLPELHRERRGHDFYPPVDPGMPPLYGTDGLAFAEKVIYMHYFGGSCDWWLVEYDPATREGFGYACLGDPGDAEWGYVSLLELEGLNRGLFIVERDLHWEPKPVAAANLPGWRAVGRAA